MFYFFKLKQNYYFLIPIPLFNILTNSLILTASFGFNAFVCLLIILFDFGVNTFFISLLPTSEAVVLVIFFAESKSNFAKSLPALLVTIPLIMFPIVSNIPVPPNAYCLLNPCFGTIIF